MDLATVGAAVGVMVPLGAAALYVIRSEVDRKVATVDTRIGEHEAGCAVRQEALAGTLKDIKEQGHRLENKIDRLMEAGV